MPVIIRIQSKNTFISFNNGLTRIKRTVISTPRLKRIANKNENYYNVPFDTFCIRIGWLVEPQLVPIWRISENQDFNAVQANLSGNRISLIFKDSVWREYSTNLDAKGTKRSVIKSAMNFQKLFSRQLHHVIKSLITCMRKVDRPYF